MNTHTVSVYDAAGTSAGSFTFSGNLANGSNQATILIATTEAAAFFGITADLVMTAVLPRAGGKVCWENLDCVAWGSYTGPGTPSAVGTPFNAGGGLVLGQAIRRDVSRSGGATTLESSDDTNDSAADFLLTTPAPRNNAGSTGTPPASTCGNSMLEGLEGCDDGNTTAGDGCDATCKVEGAPLSTTTTTLAPGTSTTTTTTIVPCSTQDYAGLLCVIGTVPTECAGQTLPAPLTHRTTQAHVLVERAEGAAARKARRLLGNAIKALHKAQKMAGRPKTVDKVGTPCAQALALTLSDASERADVLRGGL